ncbi:unnamed protein product [Caenorhabditis angaria]|uniref:ABC transporter domain-containing protein n=1 Tax=Caenorhabditis angaria TaxID=860376 RepID=A0A9P1MYT6_9PELO|nr:unnamed protein product [Caenorhabditis angaria]
MIEQLKLLIKKDFILMGRNKKWTAFETVIPALLMCLIWYIISNMGFDVELVKTKPLNNITFTIFEKSPNNLCGSKIAYVNSGNSKDVELLINTLSATSSNIVEYKDEKTMFSVLKDGVKKSYCEFGAGIVFDEVDRNSKVFKYRIYITVDSEKEWHFGEEWEKSYEIPEKKRENPIYESSGYLNLQHYLESSFIAIVKQTSDSRSVINFEAFPEQPVLLRILTWVLAYFPTLFGLIIFINVAHVSRDIATENECVKPFLAAMGLSSPMFYGNHIFIAFLKYLPLLVCAVLPIYNRLVNISGSVFFLVLFFYGLGAITYGAMIASFFKNGTNAVKAMLLTWIISMVIPYSFVPNLDDISTCFLYGIHINGALELAILIIKSYMISESPLSLTGIFYGSNWEFTIGLTILLMIFDIIWMFGLALFVDKYQNSADFNWRSHLFKNDKKNNRLDDTIKMSELESANLDSLLDGSNEIDRARISAKNGISVKNLVKIWSSTGEKAVDGLSFEAKQGQVSVLLGHNGAGKSTTFQSLSGMIKPTHGEVKINGKNVTSIEKNTNQFVGLCPQYNPLYEKLTVEEHLWLVNGLKGKEEDNRFKEEMNRLLRDVKLNDKYNELAMNLSGGMKRKLCVCMALIGSSEVVLLDEPTAGMDPGARKDVQDLLEREKQNRTILLTTHYMDEAERLGDWILIMSHGKLVSSGTTKFLKQKYGNGYLLTVVLDVNGDKEKMSDTLEQICKFYVPSATRGVRHGQQIEIILPEISKSDFPLLFKALEAVKNIDFHDPIFAQIPSSLLTQMKSLVINSFGLSLNTIEQVFITIGDKVDEAMFQKTGISEKSGGKTSFQKYTECHENGSKRTGISQLFYQIIAIFRKKLLYTRRSWGNIFGQIILPILIMTFACFMLKHDRNRGNVEGRRELDLHPTRVVWDGKVNLERQENLKNLLGSKFFHEENAGQIPRAGFGFNRQANTIMFNIKSYHVTPGLISLYNKERLMEPGEKYPQIESEIIVVSNEKNNKKEDISQLARILFFPAIVISLSIIVSSFVMFLVEERESKFTHQQFLTGISPLTFYITSFIFDFLMFSAICTILVGIMIYFDHWKDTSIILVGFWFLYFFASVPFIYAVSTFFKTPSKAHVFLITWLVIFSGIAAISAKLFWLIAMFVTKQLDEKSFHVVTYAIYFFLPGYNFEEAQFFAYFMYSSRYSMNIENNAIVMLLGGLISSILFVVLHFKPVRKFIHNLFSTRKSRTLDNFAAQDFLSCEAVANEINMAKTANPKDYALVIKDLCKSFGGFKALDNLHLVVDHNECFGLLGTNGAGKTTTFNILTGQEFATSGEATLGGKDVTERVPIGYCPQFDALLLDLTGREILEILGQMHGFSNYREKADIILDCVGMQKQSNKLIRYYSGGQKRKISVGVALLSPTQMIILDEPTAGIDPKARREIWELLIWTRQNSNSALMLTSHSMDECEALCSRIAVLNRGKLIAIGTSQELKSLYGNSYTMTLTLNDIQDRVNIVNQVNSHIPNSILRTPETNKTVNLVWQIPKNRDDQWSKKFEMVQNLARDLNVNDFILSQSSLEETFLRLSNSN